ncbi:MAG: hypothetical protein A2831_01510 [Candidatus Yanofskybacteria bacterium RIFCSPHIGHO2_01_FULL_44_17]|uniref:SET domain-containing protein n=1 Tax=Candidatus Yanofskybacteria bacterium RIFCSPHIGHO2_01_FULL_44_17 TaxID=1802668 RepID=A0A1F8EZE2_9BACT|nr:MAG: hypothetical protein A2831_01510 [Candidatus Yanofskybacteria bacterium RIFCSPHIGHO2_01_FULL_44_17]
MLLVKTKIGPSKIHGIGLFADQPIAKGAVVWKFIENFDLEITKTTLNTLPIQARDNILTYAYLNKDGNYVLCSDDARFFNPQDSPNVTAPQDDSAPNIAIRNIVSGEELTQNYKNFDADFERKLK